MKSKTMDSKSQSKISKKNLQLNDTKSPFDKSGTTLPAMNKTQDKAGDLGRSKSTKNMSDTKRETGIPRNVNYYRHIIDTNHATESDVEWVLKLRGSSDPEATERLRRIPNETFKFANSTLECQKEKKTTLDLKSPQNNLIGASHLIRGRIGATPSLGTVEFETGLRSSTNQKHKQLEKGWNSVQYTYHKPVYTKDFPQLFPSYNEMQKIKSWSTKNLNIKTHSGFVGHTDYPQYPVAEDLRYKNVVETYHLHKNPSETLSSLKWEMSMRYPKPEDLGTTISRKSPNWKMPVKKINNKK